MIIEINIVVDQYIGFLKGGSLMSVNTFGFENGKEVFCHCVVIAVSVAARMPLFRIFEILSTLTFCFYDLFPII